MMHNVTIGLNYGRESGTGLLWYGLCGVLTYEHPQQGPHDDHYHKHHHSDEDGHVLQGPYGVELPCPLLPPPKSVVPPV